MRYLSFFAIILGTTIIFCFGNNHVFGQESAIPSNRWMELEQGLKNDKLKKTQYLSAVDSLAYNSIDDPKLKERLELYKKLVWDSDAEVPRRRKYFNYLIINSKINGQSGKVLFYIQKFAKEFGVENVDHRVNVEKIQLYITAGDLSNAAQSFWNDLTYQKNIAIQIENGNYTGDPQSDLFLFYQMAPVFFELKDSIKLFKVLNLATQTYTAIEKMASISAWDKKMCYSFWQAAKCFGYLQQAKFNSAETTLKDIASFARLPNRPEQTREAVLQQQLLQNVTGQLIDLYILTNNIDSAKHYQQIAEHLPGINFMEVGVELLKSRAHIQVLAGDYQAAFKTMETIFQQTDTLLKRKSEEIAENMYAQALAEDEQEKNEVLQKERKKMIVWITVGVSMMLAVIGLLIRSSIIKKKRTQEKIDHINQLTQIEIAELTMKTNSMQRKFGMELHNDIAGQLVYLCNSIDSNLVDESDEAFRNKLQELSNLARDSYQKTREKSHEMYAGGIAEEFSAYSESIHKVATYAFPPQHYETLIEIDNESLKELSHSLKVAVLRIIQEAFVNILKHAEANKVWLYLYEEDHRLQVQIKDNGKGFDDQYLCSSKGIGLKAFQNKIGETNGTLNINSSKNGTELIISIPI